MDGRKTLVGPDWNMKKWSGARDSNPGPHGPEPCALPDCASPRRTRDRILTAPTPPSPPGPGCNAPATSRVGRSMRPIRFGVLAESARTPADLLRTARLAEDAG